MNRGAMDDDEDLWPTEQARRGIRLPVGVALLLALLIAAGGIWGGAALQRSHGSGSAGASTFASLRASFGGAAGRGASLGAGLGFGGASSAAATGTVTVVQGDTIYLTTPSGAIEKVVISSSTKMTRNATATEADLQPGDTVVVQGTKAKDGNVDATSLTATAAGAAG